MVELILGSVFQHDNLCSANVCTVLKAYCVGVHIMSLYRAC